MQVVTALLCQAIGEQVIRYVSTANIDYRKIVNDEAVWILLQIVARMNDQNRSAFEVVDSIANILMENGLPVSPQYDL